MNGRAAAVIGAATGVREIIADPFHRREPTALVTPCTAGCGP